MKHLLTFDGYLNEAFKPISIKGFTDGLHEKKDSILKIMKTKSARSLVAYLNRLFKNKIPQSEQSLFQINDYVKEIVNEIGKIEKKISKYPKLKPYLREELKEEKILMKFLKSKNRKYINLRFSTYDEYYRLEKKNIIGKVFHWLEKFFSINLFQNEYTKKGYLESIKRHDLGVSSAYFDIVKNNLGIILKEDIGKKVNTENYDQFVKLLESVLRHEITHMRDFLNKGVKEMRDNSMYVPYLEQKTEIKSYAEEVILQLKQNRFKQKEIEEILINPRKNLNKVQASDALETYYMHYYATNKMVYYRLISEALDVLNKQYENEKIR